VLGLLYAAWWLVQADRTRDPAQKTSAAFYGIGGIVIAYPLLWETTVRFGLLPGAVVAPSIIVFFVLGLVVARRRDLRVLAWIVAAGAVATIVALLSGTSTFMLYAATLLVAAAAVETIESIERWPELRWLLAGAVDLVLVLLALLVSQPRPSAEFYSSTPPGDVIVLALVAPVIWLASVATATLARRRPISLFELVQVSASLVAGFHGGSSTGIAVSIALIGAACYAAAFLSIDAEENPPRNFYAYSTFAGLLVGAGTAMLLAPAALAETWLTLAAVAIATGVVRRRNTLRLHGALYLAAAALPSGLASLGLRGLIGTPEDFAVDFDAPAALVLTAAIAAYAVLAARIAPDVHWSDAVPRLLVAALASWGIAGVAAPLLTSALISVAPHLERAAYLASVRTIVVSVLAIALAWSGRRWDLPDLRWLVFPMLIAGGARLAWEDVSLGGPMNLFLALVFYGGALTMTSRLLRQEQ
jgi:hypothetical protein